MSDYKERFRERFVREDGLLGIGKYDEPALLAFIDDVEREAHVSGYFKGREQERSSLIEKVEGMKTEGRYVDCNGPDCCAFAVLDDLLTHLRGPEFLVSDKILDLEEMPPGEIQIPQSGIQEETECCCEYVDKDTIQTIHCCPQHGHPYHRSHKPLIGYEDAPLHENYPKCCEEGHKPRTERRCNHGHVGCDANHLYPPPRTEETDENLRRKICEIGAGRPWLPIVLKAFEETEKEGASFSGRERESVIERLLAIRNEAFAYAPKPVIRALDKFLTYLEAGEDLKEIELRGEAWERGRLTERAAIAEWLGNKSVQFPQNRGEWDETMKAFERAAIAIHQGVHLPRPKENTTPQSREQRGWGVSDEEADAAIERYQKAKENGTLDEEFPVIGTKTSREQGGEHHERCAGGEHVDGKCSTEPPL